MYNQMFSHVYFFFVWNCFSDVRYGPWASCWNLEREKVQGNFSRILFDTTLILNYQLRHILKYLYIFARALLNMKDFFFRFDQFSFFF